MDPSIPPPSLDPDQGWDFATTWNGRLFLIRKIPYELRCMHCMEGGWERSRRGSRVRNQRNSRSRQKEKQKEARLALGQGTRMRKEKGK